MKISVDNQLRQINLDPSIQLRVGIKELVDSLTESRRRVVRIVVDDVEITGKFDHEKYDLSFSDVEKIELFTADPFVLALDSIPMLQDFIMKMKLEIGSATEWYRFGRVDEASNSMARIADGLTLITHTIERLRSLLELDFSCLIFNEKPILDHYSKLAEMIEELIGAQNETDWILVADLLEYELLPVIEDWDGILGLLSQKGSELLNVAAIA